MSDATNSSLDKAGPSDAVELWVYWHAKSGRRGSGS